MADISQITLPSGSTYDIKDATARELIGDLSKYTKFLGVTTTALTDGATTNPIIVNGQSVTAQSGNIVTYGSSEFIFNGTAWQAFGDLSGLGSLAYKNSVSATSTPSGSITQPTITVTPATGTVNSITDVGALPELTTTVSNEILTLGWSAGTLPTKGANTSVVTGITSATASKSGNTATADVTAKRYTLGIPLETLNRTITMTCSANGTIS